MYEYLRGVRICVPVHINLVKCREEVILKQYWRVFYSDFEEIFNKYYFFNIFSQPGKWQKQQHQRNIFEIKLQQRFLNRHRCRSIDF
jgi:hypothetical protein